MPIETTLSVGDRVSYSDMANPFKVGTIIAIESGFGGRDQYKIQWDNGRVSTTPMIGPRWNTDDSDAPSADDLMDEIGQRRIEDEARAAFAAIPVEHIDMKGTAKLIRAALKAAFPATKFSVRISRSGGATDIGWDNGPTSAQVESVVGEFESQGFDGMQDMRYAKEQMYLAEDGTFVRRSYGSGLILEHRNLTSEVREHCAAVCNLYDGDEKVSGWRLSEEVYRFLAVTDLSTIDYRTITTLYPREVG